MKNGENGLRLLDVRRDLGAVADLIELCFQGSIDQEGQGYLRHLRQAARYGWLTGWSPFSDGEDSATGMSGYVWIEDGRLVGNLSIFPFRTRGRFCWLVANVAVHPEFRGRGIATQLTCQALESARRQGIASVWLQVREDNPPAVHIYQKLGFRERTRRTTWITASEMPAFPHQAVYTLEARSASHWPNQRAWLERLYPAEFAWHLPIRWSLLRPDWQGRLVRLLAMNFPCHWSVRQGDNLLGVLTWLPVSASTNQLLLAFPPDFEEKAVQSLLIYGRRHLEAQRQISINLPAGLAVEALKASGFIAQHTLIWMEFPLSYESFVKVL